MKDPFFNWMLSIRISLGGSCGTRERHRRTCELVERREMVANGQSSNPDMLGNMTSSYQAGAKHEG